jgi:hypothetical protein
MPSEVFGPVLRPPWSLHRPLAIAGHWHGVPQRFFAPQRLTVVKSPGGLSFLSHPRRRSGGVSTVFCTIPHPSPRFSCRHCPNNGLAPLVNVDMLHCNVLLARLARQPLHRLKKVATTILMASSADAATTLAAIFSDAEAAPSARVAAAVNNLRLALDAFALENIEARLLKLEENSNPF